MGAPREPHRCPVTGRRRALAGAFALLTCASQAAIAADPAPSAAALDEGRPTGREVVPLRGRPEPASTPVVACSFHEPVCIRAAPSVDSAVVLTALRHGEDALRAYRALGLPPPLPRDGVGAFDLHLVPGATPLTAADLAPSSDGWDRRSAYAVLPPPSRHAGCAAAFAVAHAVAQGLGMRFDAGAEAGALSMAASYLASLVAPCSSVETAAIDDFQRHPERSFAAADPALPDGALLFPAFLDEAYGRGAPGLVMTSLLALVTQKTPAGSLTWNNEPDVFDSLRAIRRDRQSSLDALLIDFAVARAFVGSRSDGAHLADVERFGDAGRVRFEWSVPFDSLPRRLASGAPIEPLGMSYLWVDTAGAPAGSELTFVADWELPALFHWALVKVDKSGAEVGRLDVAAMYGASHVERTLIGLDGLAGVMVVGVNAGSMDRAHPFDPDEQPLMPHAYTVTLVR